MNKRQAKKYRSKVVYPIIDEFNLLTLDEKELKEAQKDFENYCLKHHHYKRYKDREKIGNKPCFYRYPVGKSVSDFIKLTSGRNKPVIVYQNLDILKDSYKNNEEVTG